MNFIKILIAEDEVLIDDYIKEILENNGCKNVFMTHSVSETQEKMKTLQPDVVLMDINLEGHFEGIKLSNEKNEETSVIFITGQTDSKMVENALATTPESYLTKPIREVDLLTAIKIIIQKKQKQYVFVKDGYSDIKLKLADIVYIQSDRNYLDIITTNSKFTIRNTLLEFSKVLPSSFKQIHRSIFINSAFLEKISSDEVVVNSFKLPLSRNYRQNL
ncbi:response regulator transcription factor [Epilithonimonas sp.]|uniref:LytR/AlgR family response regulator transcription factor n=1 Tax=Epilithonimonas sp. TaxID=2894511 RepID=UPI00289CDC77|nr:response regulator transcription factor [Epilithonimonas sp.]